MPAANSLQKPPIRAFLFKDCGLLAGSDGSGEPWNLENAARDMILYFPISDRAPSVRAPSDGGRSSVVESRIVIPVVAGSIPVGHPIIGSFFLPGTRPARLATPRSAQ